LSIAPGPNGHLTILEIPTGRIIDSAFKRPTDEKNVAIIAASIEAVGLINPICVRETAMTREFFQIIAGHHRYAAMKSLGRETVTCIVVEMDNLHAELAEIDENLMRANLTRAQEASALIRRKVIYEELHPQTKHGANAGPSGQFVHTGNASFVTATAAATGKSERSIRRAAARGAALGDDLDSIAGTSLDSGVEIDALAKMPAGERAPLIERAKAGEKVSGMTSTVRKRRDGSEITIIDTSECDGPVGEFTDPIIRTNGFMFRAGEALRNAKYDDLAGLELSKAVILELKGAASEVVEAWREIEDKLDEKLPEDMEAKEAARLAAKAEKQAEKQVRKDYLIKYGAAYRTADVVVAYLRKLLTAEQFREFAQLHHEIKYMNGLHMALWRAGYLVNGVECGEAIRDGEVARVGIFGDRWIEKEDGSVVQAHEAREKAELETDLYKIDPRPAEAVTEDELPSEAPIPATPIGGRVAA
jgi:ParB family transcriptional regulator, chromosome partitioning protein